jgi:membrane glycosyltransferase
MIEAALHPHAYFGAERTLFPIWPADRALEVRWLLAVTAMLLFGPKVMALLNIMASSSRARSFGGRVAVLAGAALELAFSMLMAPVMMLLHTGFIVGILAGSAVGWSAQARGDHGVAWRIALRRHGWHMMAGWTAAGILAWLAPSYLPWVLAVIAGLVVAAPLTVLSSSRRSGLLALRLGLLVTPEERDAPAELRTLLPDRRRRDRPPAADAPVGLAQAAAGD